MKRYVRCPVCDHYIVNLYSHAQRTKDAKHRQLLDNIKKESEEIFDPTRLSQSLNDIEEPMGKLLGRLNENRPDIQKAFLENCNTQIKDRGWVFDYDKFYNIKMLENKCHVCKKERSSLRKINIIGNLDFPLISNQILICDICSPTFNTYPLMAVSKKMSFASAHFLPFYNGDCGNVHGHEWYFEVEICSHVMGHAMMVCDFKKLKRDMKEHVCDLFDHDILNNHVMNPTAENICLYIWEVLMKNNVKGISRISVWESLDSKASLTIRNLFKHYAQDYTK